MEQMLLAYDLSKESVIATISQFSPEKLNLYFQATGSVNNLNKKAENPRSDRNLTARCPDNVDVVRDSVRRSSKVSLQEHSQDLGLSRA